MTKAQHSYRSYTWHRCPSANCLRASHSPWQVARITRANLSTCPLHLFYSSGSIWFSIHQQSTLIVPGREDLHLVRFTLGRYARWQIKATLSSVPEKVSPTNRRPASKLHTRSLDSLLRTPRPLRLATTTPNACVLLPCRSLCHPLGLHTVDSRFQSPTSPS